MDNSFSLIDNKQYTAWTLICGAVMVGTYVANAVTHDAFTVMRVDGTTCIIPRDKCRPATEEDILAAISFYTK